MDDQGWPRRGGELSASDAFELLAQDDEAKKAIAKLHDKLKQRGFWMWSLGAIERHVGIEGKKQSVRSRFLRRLEAAGIPEAVTDAEGVRGMLDWLVSED